LQKVRLLCKQEQGGRVEQSEDGYRALPRREVVTMKILAVIPCRANSTRVPGKNLLCLGPEQKPNLVRTIEAVRESHSVESIVVISDDPEALDLAEKHDCATLKEPRLLAEKAVFLDVLYYVLKNFDTSVSVAGTFAPNVPIRPSRIIDRMVDHMVKTNADMMTVVRAVPTHYHPYQLLRYYGEGRVIEYCLADLPIISQKFPPIYANTAAGELFRVSIIDDLLSDHRGAYSRLNRQAVVCKEHEVVEIDTPEDVLWANFLLHQPARL
jgi:CMP-N-acetylneuraminic acid synthetase